MSRMKRPRCSSCGLPIEKGNEGFGGWVWANAPAGTLNPWTKLEVCRECTPQAVLDLAEAVRKSRPRRHRSARRERQIILDNKRRGKKLR